MSSIARALLCLLLLVVPVALDSAAQQDTARERLLDALRASGRVGETLVDAYRQRDRVRVVITLDVPRRGSVLRGERRERIRAQGDRALRDCPPADFELEHRFEHAPGIGGWLHLRALPRLVRNPAVKSIDLVGGGGGALAEAMSLVGGYTALTAGFTAVGVTAATLDSGVDTDHPDLAPALVDEHCVCPSCCPGGASVLTGPGAAEDDNAPGGHGTLVAGTLLSRANTLSSLGMAPAAGLVAVKVLDSSLTFQSTLDVIAALEWVRDNYTVAPPMTSTVRVVNMSLATSALFTGDCDNVAGAISMMSDVVDDLEDNGVLVVAAAGNSGDTTQLPAPACISNVVSVGAVWDSSQGTQMALGCTDPLTDADQITCFSNAPANTDLFAAGGLTVGPALGGGLGVSSGTSFASPLVAGCAALLFEQDDQRTPPEVAALLTASPTMVTDPATMFSFPRLDCGNALGLGPDDDDSDFDDITVGEGDNCPAVFNVAQNDVEGDGVGDACDVCAFVSDPAQIDTDENGTGDACECIGPDHWPGDVDQDGDVDSGDFLILEFNFGDTGVLPTNGDQNCDDVIDGADYTLWADHLGRNNSELDPS